MRIQVFLKNFEILENEILKHFLVRNGKIFMKENPKAVTVLVTTYYSTYLVRSDGLSGWANDCTQTTSGQESKGGACCAVKTTTFLSINLSTTIYIYIYSRSILPIEIPNLKIQKHFHYPLFFIPHVFRH